jgi:hypothetical protein
MISGAGVYQGCDASRLRYRLRSGNILVTMELVGLRRALARARLVVNRESGQKSAQNPGPKFSLAGCT